MFEVIGLTVLRCMGRGGSVSYAAAYGSRDPVLLSLGFAACASLIAVVAWVQ